MNPPPFGSSNPPPKCGLAIASLILGIAGIVLCFGPLAGIPAVICGHIALSRISNSAGALSGQRLAITGLVTGYLSIVWVLVIGFMAAIAIPNFAKARQAAQRAACIANLHAIQAAKETWALEFKKKISDTPEDSDLFGPGKNVQEKPACPASGIYSLNPVGEKATCTIPGHEL